MKPLRRNRSLRLGPGRLSLTVLAGAAAVVAFDAKSADAFGFLKHPAPAAASPSSGGQSDTGLFSLFSDTLSGDLGGGGPNGILNWKGVFRHPIEPIQQAPTPRPSYPAQYQNVRYSPQTSWNMPQYSMAPSYYAQPTYAQPRYVQPYQGYGWGGGGFSAQPVVQSTSMYGVQRTMMVAPQMLQRAPVQGRPAVAQQGVPMQPRYASPTYASPTYASPAAQMNPAAGQPQQTMQAAPMSMMQSAPMSLAAPGEAVPGMQNQAGMQSYPNYTTPAAAPTASVAPSFSQPSATELELPPIPGPAAS